MSKKNVAALLVCVLSAAWMVGGRVAADGLDEPHAYFNALVARPDHWKSYSLRSNSQLDYPKNGGMANSNDERMGLWVTYAPDVDPDPHRQDAAKVVIPAFIHWHPADTLAVAVSAQDSTLTMVTGTKHLVKDVSLLLDQEIVQIVERNGDLLTVIRGAHGTTPAPHQAGTAAKMSNNSLPNQVRIPLGTSDGYTYLFVWDAYWTDSYLNYPTHSNKTFQFSARNDRLWHELRTRFDGGTKGLQPSGYNPAVDVSAVDVRSYQPLCSASGGDCTDWSKTNGNHRGPGATGEQPMGPIVGFPIIKANRWSRWFVQIEQITNDWDRFSMWVATEDSDPIKVYDNVLVSVPPPALGTGAIDKFWLEYNSSQVRHIRGDTRDLVSYVRNFVALRNPGGPGNWSNLIVRPNSGTDLLPLPGPQTPINLRLLK